MYTQFIIVCIVVGACHFYTYYYNNDSPNVVYITLIEQKGYLDAHNEKRREVANGDVKGQPAATNLKNLKWDLELAMKAAGYAKELADTNTFEHNPDRTVRSKRFVTGENLYKYATTDLNVKTIDPYRAIESWFLEHKQYFYGRMKSLGLAVIGHYTQLVWADTKLVGCSHASAIHGKMKVFMVVCNYGPTGNVIGEKPYEKD